MPLEFIRAAEMGTYQALTDNRLKGDVYPKCHGNHWKVARIRQGELIKISFINRYDRVRYGKILKGTDKKHVKGKDYYPQWYMGNKVYWLTTVSSSHVPWMLGVEGVAFTNAKKKQYNHEVLCMWKYGSLNQWPNWQLGKIISGIHW